MEKKDGKHCDGPQTLDVGAPLHGFEYCLPEHVPSRMSHGPLSQPHRWKRPRCLR